MKLLIASDMEGISGVTHWDQVSPEKPEYQRFRTLMTADVNAAIEGASEAGVDEIIVADGHSSGSNILIEQLDPRARLHSGNDAPNAMLQGIDKSINAAFFIGYHARAGTLNAVCDHTWSSRKVMNVTLNNRPVGEIGLNASLCGYYGVPVLLISGDQAAVQEAQSLIKGVDCVIVKKATSRQSAECLHPEEARRLIREGAGHAIRRYLAGKYPLPHKTDSPLTFEITFTNSSMADSACRLPGAMRLDARTIRLVFNEFQAAYHGFIAAVNLA